eukprot:m.347547 g.347547  ORF g.347547 m.347547 type:complete len:794 (-) comp55857_c0_seq1:210-2591(-)
MSGGDDELMAELDALLDSPLLSATAAQSAVSTASTTAPISALSVASNHTVAPTVSWTTAPAAVPVSAPPKQALPTAVSAGASSGPSALATNGTAPAKQQAATADQPQQKSVKRDLMSLFRKAPNPEPEQPSEDLIQKYETRIQEFKKRITQFKAEIALHIESKNDLARDLESARSDLFDQRATFKKSLEQSDATIAQLRAKLAESSSSAQISSEASAEQPASSSSDSNDGNSRREDAEQVMLLSAKVARLVSDTNTLTRENESLRSQLQSAAIAFTALEHEKGELSTRLTELKGQLQESSGSLRTTTEKLSKADNALRWTQNKLQAETDRATALTDQLAKASTKAKELAEEKQQLREEYGNLMSRLKSTDESATHALVQLRNELTAVTAERDALQSSSAKLSEQLKTGDEEKSQLLATLTAAQEACTLLQREKTASFDHIHSLDAEILRLKAVEEQCNTLQASRDAEEDEARLLLVGNQKLAVQLQEKETALEAVQVREATAVRERDTALARNAELSLLAGRVQETVAAREAEARELHARLATLDGSNASANMLLNQLRLSSSSELTALRAQVDSQTETVVDLRTQLADAQEQLVLQQRKSMQTIREMAKQLQSAAKRAESDEKRSSSQDGVAEMHAQESAVSASFEETDHPHMHIESAVSANTVGSVTAQPLNDTNLQTNHTKLQTNDTKLQRKILFLEEHTAALTLALQNKEKILQMFFLREKAGLVGPSESDTYKGKASKGLRDLPLQTQLEINRKLQEVLEDYALQNIQLKACVDTLGNEIARLRARPS